MSLCDVGEAEENLGTVKDWDDSVLVEEFFSPLIIRLARETWEAKFDLDRSVCTHPAGNVQRVTGAGPVFPAKTQRSGQTER